MYGRTHAPGMGPYPIRVRRELDVGQRATLLARWIYEPQFMNDQPMGEGFQAVRGEGDIDLGDHFCVPGVVGVVYAWEAF